MNEKIKILMVVTRLTNTDGVTSFALNICKNINHEKFELEFISHGNPDSHILTEIINYGGKIHVFPSLSLKNLSKIKLSFLKLLNENHFHVIHCNLPNISFLYLGLAKKYNVPIRIIHSHATKLADTFFHSLRNSFLWFFGKNSANIRLACSNAAGHFLFKNKPFVTLYNGLDYSRFMFDSNARTKIRFTLGLNSNDILLGEIGRVCPQKNQSFSIEVIKKLPSNYYLLCIGSVDKNYFSSLAITNKIKHRIIFIPPQNDIEKYYSALDFFILPSQYEGLPFSLVEAQVSGLLCLASKNITTESNFSNVTFLPLAVEEWTKKILSFSSHYPHNSVYSEKFDLNIMISTLEKIYSN